MSKCYLSIRKQNAPEGVHISNKNESTLLRKIMSESGLNEGEVRKIKKYRIMLSEAQDVGDRQKFVSRRDKAIKSIMKDVTKRLKLAKEHPLVIAEFKKQFASRAKFDYYLRY